MIKVERKFAMKKLFSALITVDLMQAAGGCAPFASIRQDPYLRSCLSSSDLENGRIVDTYKTIDEGYSHQQSALFAIPKSV